jgi:hypothetical protein
MPDFVYFNSALDELRARGKYVGDDQEQALDGARRRFRDSLPDAD